MNRLLKISLRLRYSPGSLLLTHREAIYHTMDMLYRWNNEVDIACKLSVYLSAETMAGTA